MCMGRQSLQAATVLSSLHTIGRERKHRARTHVEDTGKFVHKQTDKCINLILHKTNTHENTHV